MQQDFTSISVLLGYPSDAAAAADEVAAHLEDHWNNTTGTLAHYRIEVKRWLSPYAVPAGYSDSGRQGAINESFLRDADIVIALFVNKLGSPWTDPSAGITYESGTVAEVELGRAARKVVRVLAASSDYVPTPSADPCPPYADVGEWRGPQYRERRLQEKLGAWAAEGFYPLEWDSTGNLLELVDRALASDLSSRRGRPSIAQFLDACAKSVRLTTEEIGKYQSALFVNRRAADRDFLDFMASGKPALALTGAAGMGKTNQLCHMALERCGGKPTLLLRGAAIPSGEWGVWSQVLSVLWESGLPSACRDSLRREGPMGVSELLHAWMEAWGTELVIHIDGINENNNISGLSDSLGRAARTAASKRIRLFMSCRDVDWHRFESEPVLAYQLYSPPDAGSSTSRRILMQQFTDEEYGQAWPKYQKRYELKGSPEKDLELLCHDPLMLLLLGIAFEGTDIPPGANRDKIFDKYVENTFTKEGKDYLWALVEELARRVYSGRDSTDASEITWDGAVAAVGNEQTLQMISSLDIILGDRQDQSERRMVHFKYDAFFEYTLARALRVEWNWKPVPVSASDDPWARKKQSRVPDATDRLRDFIGNSRDYRFLNGCLLYLLRFLLTKGGDDGTDAADAILADAARGLDPSSGQRPPISGAEQVRWKTFFCGFVMTDLETAGEYLGDVVALADDPSSVVRWSAGLALGTMSVPEASMPEANEALEGLEKSRGWRGRETAAVALRQFHRTFDDLTTRLEPLADDLNWRVRRQAGNTLGDLCLLNRDSAMALLSLWAKADNWRLRRCVVQARAGLMTDPSFAMNVLEQMVTDPREEIRWRSINVLANLVKPHRAYVDRTLILFAHLATADESVWVRRHVASRLHDLHHAASAQQRATTFRDVAEAVVRDPHEHVRWAAARALGSFADGEQDAAVKWLEMLETVPDDQDRVGFAIRYSRAQIAMARAPRPRRGPRTVRGHMEAVEPASKSQAKIEELARSSFQPPLDMLNAALYKNDRYTNIQDAIHTALVNDDDTQLGEFFALLRLDEDEGLRWGAASALARQDRIRGPQLDKAILDFSNDYQYWVRRECLTALTRLIDSDGFLPSQQLISQILELTKDPEAEVRNASLACLLAVQSAGLDGALGEDALEAIVVAIRELGNDPDRQVALFAKSAAVP